MAIFQINNTGKILDSTLPQANGFVEVFNKVLVKLVHTATVEKKDPRKVLHRYLASYRAAPHKTTGKSPYELMFNRKMMTKLPQLPIKPNMTLDKVVRQRHDEEKMKQKKYVDQKRRVKEKEVQLGDNIMIKQKKSSVKTPWDPQPYKVVGIKGSKVTAQRGDQTRERAKNNIKVVKPRPDQLKVKSQRKVKVEADHDLEVDMNKIRVLSRPAQVHPEQAREEEEQGEQEQRGVEEYTPDEGDTSEDGNEEELTEEGEDIASGEEEQLCRPVRAKKPPQRYNPAQVGPQQLKQRGKLSPRERKRAQSQARFKRSEEPLHTEMRIKERWEVAGVENEIEEEEN